MPPQHHPTKRLTHPPYPPPQRQLVIVEFGGKFVKTSPLPVDLWAWSVLFGFLAMPLALLLKLLFPIHEAPCTFFGYGSWRVVCGSGWVS